MSHLAHVGFFIFFFPKSGFLLPGLFMRLFTGRWVELLGYDACSLSPLWFLRIQQ